MGTGATFIIHGTLIDRSTGNGIPHVLIKAWDADLFFDDLLGSTITDDNGSFRMSFDSSYFDELSLDHTPEMYFEIFYKGKCVYSSRGDQTVILQPGEQDIKIEVDGHIFEEETREEPVYPDPRQHPEVPVDDPVDHGDRIQPPAAGEWKNVINNWWKRRKEERRAAGTLHEPTVPIPKPYMDCTSNFGPQLNRLSLSELSEMTFTIWNDGNFPAWTCYAELYEGPRGYSHPLRDYELRGRIITTLRPGERRDISIPWVRRRESGRVVGIVFDPLLDPKDFNLVEQRNRHITSIHYGLF